MNPAFEYGLVRSQCRFKALRIASDHARHLAEAETEFAQRYYLRDAGHLIGTIGPPSSRGAGRRDQSTLFVKPQSLDGNAEPPGSLGRTQELRGEAHESPRNWPTAILIGAAPRARSRAGSSGNRGASIRRKGRSA